MAELTRDGVRVETRCQMPPGLRYGAAMAWFGKKKSKAPTPDTFQSKIDEFLNEMVDGLGTYSCSQCGEEHVAHELAFRLPDLAGRRGVADDAPDDQQLRPRSSRGRDDVIA